MNKNSVGNGNGSVIPAAIILGASSLVSRLVGLVRERVLATTYGAGDVTDAFLAAFRVPDLIFNLVTIGALSAAFIPLFTAKLVKGDKGDKSAFVFAAAVLNLLLVVVAVCSLIYAIFAPAIVPLITPGFHTEKLEVTIMLSRIMALQPILLTASFVVSGVLNSYKRFTAYALAPVLYNVGIIIGVKYLAPTMGLSGLAWGVVLGAVLHISVQLPSFWRVGFRWKPRFISSWSDFKAIWQMMVPRVFGLGVEQVKLMVVTILGSGLLSGSISVFTWANNLQFIPIGIFGLAFAQAAFPTMAEQVARGQQKEFRRTLTKTFRYILFFVIPVSVLFYLLRAQIVRVLFGDGAFDWEDTIMTFETLGILMISVFAQATIPLLTRAFYVEHDTKTPVIVSIISIVVNVVLALVLSPRFGVQGLAFAFSASAILQLLLLLGILHWQLKGFDDRQVLWSLARISGSSLLAGVIAQVLKYPVAMVVDMQRYWGIATQLTVSFAGGILMYVAVCWLFKSPELMAIKHYLPRKFKPVAGVETSRFGGMVE